MDRIFLPKSKNYILKNPSSVVLNSCCIIMSLLCSSLFIDIFNISIKHVHSHFIRGCSANYKDDC